MISAAGLLVEREGDMFAAAAGAALGHGVNCRGVMGAGVAATVRRRFPDGYREYRSWCQSGRLRPGGVHVWAPPGWDEPVLVNLASQDRPGPDARIDWLRDALAAAAPMLADLVEQDRVRRLVLSRIGCGIGGLTWVQVRPILADSADVMDVAQVRVEVWTPRGPR